DFDLQTLSRFLQGLRIGQGGFAFVVELRADGGRRVIAHPRPEILTGPARRRHPAGRDLPPADELQDARVPAFLAELPAAADAGGLRGTGSVRFSHGGESFLGSYHRIRGEHRPPWLVCTVLPEEGVLAHAHRSNRLTFLITLGALGVAGLVSVWVSRQV